MGDLASAEQDFRRAMEISREIQHPRGVTLNLIALGNIELRRRRPEQAQALYRDALARATETGDYAATASARIQLAFSYADLGRLMEAMREAEAAATVAREAGARPLEAQAEYAGAEVARRDGRIEKAIQRFLASQRILESAPDPELGWRIEYGRGQALESSGKAEEAVTAYQRAVGIIEELRSQLREERFRSGYLEDKYQVYVTLVQLLLKLGRLDEAFAYSEKLRARSFLDLLERGGPPIRDAVQRQAEMALRERVRQLRREMEAETSKPVPQQKRQALEAYTAELAQAEREYQNLLDDLARGEPRLAGARAAAIPAIRAVQGRLPEDVALIEYVVGEKEVVMFVLRRNGLQARAVPHGAAELQARIDLLRGLMAREHGEEWRRPAASLYSLLIQPVEQGGWLAGVKRLYVVPHGILHYVPFAALPASSEPSGSLLIEQYEVTYLPAAAALVFGPGSNNSHQSVMALAPARSRLQFTQAEARSVAAAFPGRKELLLGSRATEGSFKRLAGRFDVLHLATHGFFNKNNPLLSGVDLEPEAEEDGRLEVHEILELRLNAHLVTLSACETALGGGYFSDVPAGDDLVGLTRAFLYAGSPSVLATLWEVNDRSTLRLMQGFYRRLASAQKAGALAQAQRAMLRRGGREAHPYFWGAFILVGQMN
ncbi:MAG: CHAT domain-containing protein [Acidobacteria bacterium]|nr:CHAT domain-containing protein [Acidobacteriota bacterium]